MCWLVCCYKNTPVVCIKLTVFKLLLNAVRLPWFRVHSILINDPGRLISVHLMHTALVAGWSGSMLVYELIIIDPSDPVYNPIWRQGSYVLPYASKLGVVTSLYSWTLSLDKIPYAWSYETIALSHILLSGLLVLRVLYRFNFPAISDT